MVRNIPRSCVGAGGPCPDSALVLLGSRCARCQADMDRRRGKTSERMGKGWARISKQVIKRDKGVCWICGLPGADTADHLIPRAQGGGSDTRELAAAHRTCNSRRGAKAL